MFPRASLEREEGSSPSRGKTQKPGHTQVRGTDGLLRGWAKRRDSTKFFETLKCKFEVPYWTAKKWGSAFLRKLAIFLLCRTNFDVPPPREVKGRVLIFTLPHHPPSFSHCVSGGPPSIPLLLFGEEEKSLPLTLQQYIR